MIIATQKELGNVLKKVYKSMNNTQAEFMAYNVFAVAKVMVQNFGEDRVFKEIDKAKPSDFKDLGEASKMFYAAMLLFGFCYNLDEEGQMKAAAITVRNFFDIHIEKQYALCDAGVAIIQYANKNRAEIKKILSEK